MLNEIRRIIVKSIFKRPKTAKTKYCSKKKIIKNNIRVDNKMNDDRDHFNEKITRALNFPSFVSELYSARADQTSLKISVDVCKFHQFQYIITRFY